jgi:DNA repair exonuclease SbcCD nuclease subunit
MKIAIVNDTHWGVRNDNKALADYQKQFWEEIFFPYLKENNIKTIFHLGDVVDRRKYINFVTAKRLEDEFIRPCVDNDIDLYMVAGNHDTFYKNTNEVNALRQLYGSSAYEKLHLYWDGPVELNLEGCDIMLSPWICVDNYEQSMEAFKNTKAQILMGHFEITGFEMDKGHLCTNGMDKNVFSKFDAVYSGHFHQPSSHGNITYLGAQFEMTWADYDQKRGFSVFDTETREIEYIQNPLHIFHKIWYDDTEMTIEDVANLDTTQLTNSYIKVIITNKENPYIFDLFLDRLQQSGASDIKVVDDHMNMDIINEEELVDEAQDTMTILRNYIEQLEIKADKQKVETFVGNLYQEAMNL